MTSSLSEYEKMKANLPFNPADESLLKIRARMREIELQYNQTSRYETDKREQLLRSVIGELGQGTMLLPNIHFDYGDNTKFGENVFVNVNSTFIDVASITIGANTLIGPNVTLCTATHPIVPRQRLPQMDENGIEYMLEYCRPIVIEQQVWIGAGVTINPGVHIGKGSVIGSGSVVTKDIPPGVVAAGVPCRVIREITEQDSLEIKGY